MEPRPKNSQILHSFMLWYQEKYGTAPSLADIVSYCPLWQAGRKSAHHAVKMLGKRGLAEQRPANAPGQREYMQWWALELCRDCEKRRRGQNLSVCHECADAALLQMRTRNQ